MANPFKRKLKRSKKINWVDVDKGMRRMQQTIKESQVKPHVVIGIYGGRAGAQHDAAKNLTVVQLAGVHEFGVGVPERSFIRATSDANQKQIKSLQKKIASQVLLGRMTMQRGLGLIGAFFHGRVIRAINRGIKKPISVGAWRARLRRRGVQGGTGSVENATPLVDFGQLKGSISWETRDAK